MNEQRVIETGTTNIVATQEMKQADRWLISYGWDDDIGGLLWHEIRCLTDEQRDELAKKFTDAKIQWDMLNLTSVERGEPWTIEAYIESESKRP